MSQRAATAEQCAALTLCRRQAVLGIKCTPDARRALDDRPAGVAAPSLPLSLPLVLPVLSVGGEVAVCFLLPLSPA